MERDQLADILHRTQDQQEDDILRLQQHMELQLKQQLQQQYRQVCQQEEKGKANKQNKSSMISRTINFLYIFTLQKIYERVKKSVMSVCKEVQKDCQMHFMAVKKLWKRFGFVIYSCFKDSAFTYNVLN